MPTTRRQAKLEEVTAQNAPQEEEEAQQEPVAVGEKRDAPEGESKAKAPGAKDEDGDSEEPPAKKRKKTEDGEAKDATETGDGGENANVKKKTDGPIHDMYQTGTIERGHIYFFYRPKVEHEEAHDLDDVQRFQLLLLPRPPAFATTPGSSGPPSAESGAPKAEDADPDAEMSLLQPGADVVPASATSTARKHLRLISVGKKQLPDAEHAGRGGRKETFWAAVTTVGEDLSQLRDGLGAQTYETKTRGTRHQAASRLAGRGAYAIVNNDARVPSGRTTHLGYRLSHPDAPGDVQRALGVHAAASFVLQLRNPDAAAGGAPAGLGRAARAGFPEEVMRGVFGKGEKGTSKETGLRFASVGNARLLDYEGAELLFIAARTGGDGLEESLGEGRGKALEEAEDKEAEESAEEVFKELSLDLEKFPVEALEGHWI